MVTAPHRSPTPLDELAAWRALAAHRRAQTFDLNAMFAQDALRASAFSARCGGVLLDYSRNLLNGDTLKLLLTLARECKLEEAIDRLFQGGIVNRSENRPALHVALRAASPVIVDGRDVTLDVRQEIERMRACVSAFGSRQSGVSDIIHIGIGGSYQGPAFAGDALRGYAGPGLRVHYLSTADGVVLQGLLDTLDPRATRVIVASKTFATAETLLNARAVLDWLSAALGGKTAALKQFAAITARPERAVAFGIAEECVFRVWDWVGGRYAMCSAMALPFALQNGMEHFDALLAGAREADAHFRSADFDRNIPVILALLDIWYANFHDAASRVVLPYLPGFARFPAYLQQLEMESLGKCVTQSGTPTGYDTGLVTWGESGTHGQHTFYQLLHQGTRLIPADFIIACRAHHRFAGHHQLLLANALAQSQTLMAGGGGEPHRALPGNRPSTILALPEADAFHIGMLTALYEHKTYATSVLWDINAFDQWGVELGKQRAIEMQAALSPDTQGPVPVFDASTAALIQHIQTHSGRNR